MSKFKNIDVGEMRADFMLTLRGRLHSSIFTRICVCLIKYFDDEKLEYVSAKQISDKCLCTYQHALTMLRLLGTMGVLKEDKASSRLSFFYPVFNAKKFTLLEYEDMILKAFEWHKQRDKERKEMLK